MEQEHVAEAPKKSKNLPLLIILAVIFVLAGSTAAYQFVSNKQESNSQNGQLNESAALQGEKDVQNLLIYGVWTPESSIIKGYGIENNKNYVLAKLPNNIKKVSVKIPDSLIYINNTDIYDNGKEIVSYSLENKKNATLVTADADFGIDDYVLSPDGRYMAVWEVKLLPQSSVLFGGTSKVYSIDLKNPSVKNLIYSETIDKPIHYPRAVLNNGKIFFDEFYPNTGSGWSYGMSVSDFLGKSKQEIPSMQNGTYGTQPVLSPDGKYLAFGGYDGSYGPGNIMEDGIRKALNYTNTVELLDTNTLTRTKINEFTNEIIYDDVTFDKNNGVLVVSRMTSDPDKPDIALYDIANKKLHLAPNSLGKSFVTHINKETLVAGNVEIDNNFMGNLGDTYRYPFTNYEILQLEEGVTTPLSPHGLYMQHIDHVSLNKLSKNIMVEPVSDEELQMRTFSVKPELASRRILQQNANLFSLMKELHAREQNNGSAVKGTRIIAQAAPNGLPIDPSRLASGDVSGLLNSILGMFGLGGSFGGINPGNIPALPSGITIPGGFSLPSGLPIPSGFPAQNGAPSDGHAPSGPTLPPIDLTKITSTPSKNTTVRRTSRTVSSRRGDCKPAIYLYPTKKQDVHVQLTVDGPLTYTDPIYPNDGWKVTAEPSGKITSNNKSFDYLYYEAIIPDSYFYGSFTEKGYVVEQRNLGTFFEDFLPKAGLNAKEAKEFNDYWTKALPNSPYYRITMVPQNVADKFAVLKISPKPDSLLRLTLNFQPLDKWEAIEPPTLSTFERKGFTVVEWGGTFKKDKNHPFECLQ